MRTIAALGSPRERRRGHRARAGDPLALVASAITAA
jgi:hypothetical protein